MVETKYKTWIEKTWQKIEKKLSKVAVRSRFKIPYSAKDGVHTDRKGEIDWWTNGFWGGLCWLMYEATKNEDFRISAEQNETFLEKALDRVHTLHHDVGFMWHLTSGANYRLTGNEKSRNTALICAMSLAARFNADGDYIRAWNGNNEGWSIIDTMMNLPLLYFASEQLKAPRFTRIAVHHANMAMKDHVRDDGSVNHIVVHDVDRPAVIETLGGQGYGVGSSWSRGVSWALYGFALSYLHTNREEYLQTAKKVAAHFIESVKRSAWLPLADFKAPETPVYYDSTAGAIGACGLIELYKATKDEEYLDAAVSLLQAMANAWCDFDENTDALLTMGSECHGRATHIPIIYGDFFFVEAILKLKGSSFLIW